MAGSKTDLEVARVADSNKPSSLTGSSEVSSTGTSAGHLQAVLTNLVIRQRLPHAVMAVASGDGSFRWIGAEGVANPADEPMRPGTPYFQASVTKLFTAATVFQLHETGALSLDVAIDSYLPSEVTRGIHHSNGVHLTREVTIRHLLSHTSGIADWLEDRPHGEASLYKQIAAGQDFSLTFPDLIRQVRRMEPHFPPRDLTAPHSRARYSDTNFQILIAIVEAVAGRPYHEVLEARFFRPLGMRHTWMPGRSQPLDATPMPAALYNRRTPLELPNALKSSRDVVGTADDALRFMMTMASGELFDDTSTYRLMQERWNRIGYPLRYGLGMMSYRIPRLLGPGRRPVTLIGHSGGTGSWLFHCPELDVFLAGTVDQVHGRAIPYRLMPKVLRAYASI